MKITIEGKDYNLPTSLAAVTLQQKIDFEREYGKGLRDQLKKIIEMKDEVMRKFEFTDYHCRLACTSLSFFAGIPLEIVENTAIDDVLAVYHGTMKGYAEDCDFASNEYELKNEFAWQETIWVVEAPELKNDSKMTFGEFINAKQTIQNIIELGNEKWEALLPLCCIYFRKKGEPFNEEFLNESNERYQLMKTLPLEFALHVGFFLSGYLDFWLKTFQSSRKDEEQEPAEM